MDFRPNGRPNQTRVSAPDHRYSTECTYLELSTTEENDEVLSFTRKRDGEQSGNHLESERVLDIGKVSLDILGCLESTDVERK